MTRFRKHLIPLLIVAVGAGGAYYLAKQDRAKQMTTREATAPAPVVAPMPTTPGFNPPPEAPPLPPGAVIRSLDRLNAAAAAVGCPTVVPGDPAGKLIDIAECLGEKAVARRATGERAK